MLDGLDPGAHLPLVVVVGGSAVVSLTVAAWAAFRLEPRASLVALVVSILGAVGYQARFLLPAIATDPEAAAFYASLFAWSPALMASSGLHFMVLLNELRIGRTLAFCAVLYGGALVVFSGHTSGLVVTRAVSDPVFGYLLEQSGPLDPFQRAYGGLCILALVGLAARYAIHWRHHPTRSRAAVVLVGGLALPMIGAIATITRVVDLPLYNLAVPLFHASLVVAIRRHELLTFNIEEAARPTLDAAGEAIVVVEPNGEILWLNRAAAEVYGLEVGTRPFGSDIRPCLEGAAAGSPCRGVAAEVRGVACLVAMSPIPHPEQVRVAMALTDVRHLRAAERGLVEAREVAEAARAEAEAADRAKSTFLAN
ncbi:MAG: hypothetical protein KC656_17405, partial [Myxococcales bacterium]|nr:hypothetical protein [Myxococcales bacterium]